MIRKKIEKWPFFAFLQYSAEFNSAALKVPPHSNCAMILSCKPEVVKKVVRKWGKREASVEDVMGNYCAVVYGLFSIDFRPSAH